MKRWLKEDYSCIKKEMQYKYVVNKILVEQYMEDSSGELLDYKIYCMDGEPCYYAICSNRSTKLHFDCFDKNGIRLDNVRTCNCPNNGSINIDNNTREKMFDLARKLALPFQFVRVDMYFVNGVIFFGELTFTDGAGSDPFHPKEFDLKIAKGISLVKYFNIIDESKKSYLPK